MVALALEWVAATLAANVAGLRSEMTTAAAIITFPVWLPVVFLFRKALWSAP